MFYQLADIGPSSQYLWYDLTVDAADGNKRALAPTEALQLPGKARDRFAFVELLLCSRFPPLCGAMATAARASSRMAQFSCLSRQTKTHSAEAPPPSFKTGANRFALGGGRVVASHF